MSDIALIQGALHRLLTRYDPRPCKTCNTYPTIMKNPNTTLWEIACHTVSVNGAYLSDAVGSWNLRNKDEWDKLNLLAAKGKKDE